jgi:CheY-like chemotaxis protein
MPRGYLIVDDSPVICTTLKKMLVKAGVNERNIDVEQSGDEAMKTFYEAEPDVVFMDIQMPGMDGEQTASMMMTENPELKVIVVTGMGMDDDRVQSLRSMGAFELLEKPIHTEDVDRVLQLLDREESGAGRIK